MIQSLSDALAERGYDTLTPVQAAVTEARLEGADLLVSAQTGSGKTVGFGLAIGPTLMGGAERLDRAAAPLALVIAPTRELAMQVMRELDWLYKKAGGVVISCVGGMDARAERRALERGAHIVVATPGRLRDHIERRGIDLSEIRAVVLDEADEMLDLGFREDLEFILSQAPDTRRTLLFSATVPPAIATLARKFQRDAVRVSTTNNATQHADIEYRALSVAPHDAENAIINVLRYYDAENALVFCNTRAMVARLTARFANRGFQVVALSGELSQQERTHALQAMRDGRARVCIATDVAARGIDLPNLDLVVHAELPSNPETMLHRSGRTGRAGRKGISTLIVPPNARKKAERLLQFGKVRAEWAAPPSADEVLQRDEERLLGDPVWSEDVGAEEAAFAAKLAGLHSAERIAAAYLRLYRSRQTAPEDLAAADAPRAPRERAPFGPSTWFSISTGRAARAEARWLLPLLCRAGNIGKDDIGAIRIQESESYFELREQAVAGFVKALGPSMAPEEGLTIAQLAQAPDLGGSGPRRDAPPPRHEAPRHDAPRKPWQDDKPARKPWRDEPAAVKAPEQAPAPQQPPANAPEGKAGKPKYVSKFKAAKKTAKAATGGGDANSAAPKPYKKPWARPEGDAPAKPRTGYPKGPKGPGGKPKAGPGGKPPFAKGPKGPKGPPKG